MTLPRSIARRWARRCRPRIRVRGHHGLAIVPVELIAAALVAAMFGGWGWT